MEPTGFLGGLSSGLVAAVLSNKKKEDDEFHALRENRAKQLSALADHIRPEDLPALMQGLDGVLTAKKPEQADAAYGSVMAKFIQERYDQEQQGQQYNQSIDQASQDRSAETVQLAPTQSGTSEPGTIAGQPEGATKLGTPLAYARPDTTQSASPTISLAPSQDATPVKVNPTAYAQDKIRIQTEEGKMGRAVKLYAAKEAALYKEKEEFEKARQEGIRETNRKKIEDTVREKGVTKWGYGIDPETGNATMIYIDPETKEVTEKKLGVMLPQSAYNKDKIRAAEELQKLKGTQEMDRLKAKLALAEKEYQSKNALRQEQIKKIQTEISSGKAASSGQSRLISGYLAEFKAWSEDIDKRLNKLYEEKNKVETDITLRNTEQGKILLEKIWDNISGLSQQRAQVWEETQNRINTARNTPGQSSGTGSSSTAPSSNPNVQKRVQQNTRIITFDK